MTIRGTAAAASFLLLIIGGLALATPAQALTVSQCKQSTPVNSSGDPGPVGVEVAHGYTKFATCADGIVGTDLVFAQNCSIYTGCGSSGAIDLYRGSNATVLVGFSVLYTYCVDGGQVGGASVIVAGHQYDVHCIG